MKVCCYDDHLPYTLWCSCKDLIPEVPGLNPGGGIFPPFFLIRPITITLITFFHFYSGWSLGVAVLGMYILWG